MGETSGRDGEGGINERRHGGLSRWPQAAEGVDVARVGRGRVEGAALIIRGEFLSRRSMFMRRTRLPRPSEQPSRSRSELPGLTVGFQGPFPPRRHLRGSRASAQGSFVTTAVLITLVIFLRSFAFVFLTASV